MKIVATTSLPAVDRPNADRWNAARSRQNEDNLKKEDNLKNGDNLINEDDLRNEATSNIRKTSKLLVMVILHTITIQLQ